jgi:hypothetical protein
MSEKSAPTDTARVVPEEIEERLVTLVDWAREFLATEVEGQYTSDAALQLALAVFLRSPARAVSIKDATFLGPPAGFTDKPGEYLP